MNCALLLSRTNFFIAQQENPYSFPVLGCLFCQEVKRKTNQAFVQTFNCNSYSITILSNGFISAGLVLDIPWSVFSSTTFRQYKENLVKSILFFNIGSCFYFSLTLLFHVYMSTDDHKLPKIFPWKIPFVAGMAFKSPFCVFLRRRSTYVCIFY